MSYSNDRPPNTLRSGIVEYTEQYVITGILKNGRRFRPIYTISPQHYNIWKGSIWVIRKDTGKRKLIKRINW